MGDECNQGLDFYIYHLNFYDLNRMRDSGREVCLFV